VTACARIDLVSSTTGALDALGVMIGRLVTFEDGKRNERAHAPYRRFEERCLACAWRSNEVEERNAIRRERPSIAGCELGILGE
jgi:hypothetical protein